MEIKVTTSKTTPSFANHANNALRHALGSARIADVLEKHDSSSVEESGVLSRLFGRRTLLLSGPNEFGGAIKGYALIGYLEYNQAAKLQSLKDTHKLDDAKRQFLESKGIDESHIGHVSDSMVALWAAYRKKAIVAPTSGSFGLTAYETVQKLRALTIEIDGRKVPLFNEGEVAARAWVPTAELNIMSAEKLKFIEEVAANINCELKYWDVRETRDHYALLDAIANDDYFCPTNPKTREEFAQILGEVLKGEIGGKKIFTEEYEKLRLGLTEKLQEHNMELVATLRRFGVKIHYNGCVEVMAHKPVSAGRYGLMLARLDHWEYLLKTSGAVNDETYNQPSIGATLAGAGEVDRAILMAMKGELKLDAENIKLLEEQYPKIAETIKTHSNNVSLKLFATPDACNITLCNQLGMKGDVPATNGLSPSNGLGTITPGQEPASVLLGCKETSLQEHYLAATKPWMAVAQALIFLHEVQMKRPEPRFPEEAGAASLAGYLREQHKTGSLSVDDIVFALRNNGFDRDVFEQMLVTQHNAEIKDAWAVLYSREEAHGAGEKKFVADLERAFLKEIDQLEPDTRTKKEAGSITFYSTGYNGTRQIAVAMQTAIKRNERNILADAAAGIEDAPLRGNASGMLLLPEQAHARTVVMGAAL